MEGADMTSISLSHDFQHRKFTRAMTSLEANVDDLTPYQRDFYNDLKAAYDMLGRAMSLTVKQLNYLEQIAFDLEKDS
jgi:hypothetical protein